LVTGTDARETAGLVSTRSGVVSNESISVSMAG